MGFCLILDVLDRFDALAADFGLAFAEAQLADELALYERCARDVASRSAR
jgi:hypothetical protein